MNRKEEIIMATLELAAEKGLGSVSMNTVSYTHLTLPTT